MSCLNQLKEQSLRAGARPGSSRCQRDFSYAVARSSDWAPSGDTDPWMIARAHKSLLRCQLVHP